MKKLFITLSVFILFLSGCANKDTKQNGGEAVAQEEIKTGIITKEEALEKALAHANISTPNFIEVSLDRERSGQVYEVDFEADNFEYEYDINAYTGDVLYSNKEEDRDFYKLNLEPNTSTQLTDDTIKSIILKEANLQDADISYLKIERDFDDNREEIDVEFISNEKEYSYTLDEQGNILEAEVDNN